MRLDKEQVIEHLLAEKVLAIPTDTVYGLAAVLSEKAIKALIEIKERPPEKPFVVQVDSVEKIKALLEQDLPDFEKLSARFWPGPLTIVLPIKKGSLYSYQDRAAFRIPARQDLLEILEKTGPLAVPSANRSGQAPARSAKEVEAIFGPHFPLFDGGSCLNPIPSSIISYQEKNKSWQLLRKGILSEEEIFSALKT